MTAPDTSPEAVERVIQAIPMRTSRLSVDRLIEDTLRALSGELARARVNEARYLWLRDARGNNRLPHVTQYPRQSFDKQDVIQIIDVRGLNSGKLDAAIDAAIASQGLSHG